VLDFQVYSGVKAKNYARIFITYGKRKPPMTLPIGTGGFCAKELFAD